MKTSEKVFWAITTALLVVTLLLGAVFTKGEPMAIDFEASTGDQYIDFGNMASLKSLGTMTICAWIKAESANPYAHILDINTNLPSNGLTGDNGGYTLALDNASGQIRFIADWSTSSGKTAAWDSNTSITPGNNEFICASYNSGATANDPVLYLNGASVAITELIAPSGSLIDSSPTPKTKIGFGYIFDTDTRFDGFIRKVMVYNRILTAAEILDMYNSRGASYPRNGLVFCPILYGAKGMSSFDGALAAANTIYDPYSNTYGVPNGSPVAVPETYLNIR